MAQVVQGSTRLVPSIPKEDRPPMSPRPFRPEDQAAVNALHRSVWWPERSPAGWRWLAANPARADIDAPSGWVVEGADGEPAAFLGNMVQRFWRGDALHHGATGFSTIVTPRARGASRSLFRALLGQTGLFAWYTFNANIKSAPLYLRQGLNPWPPATHDLKLSWILRPLTCLHGRLLRKATERAPRWTDPYRERFMGRRLTRPAHVTLPAGVIRLTDIAEGSPYAAFWERLRAEGRLVADRSPEILRWRLADPDRVLDPIMIAVVRDGAITGFGMAMLAKATPIEPVFLEVLDLIALKDETEAVSSMMQAMLGLGRAHGAAKVRIQTLNPELLARLGSHVATARREGGWGHCHVRFDGDPPQDWFPTPFDGDYGICLRPPPIKPSAVARRAVAVSTTTACPA